MQCIEHSIQEMARAPEQWWLTFYYREASVFPPGVVFLDWECQQWDVCWSLKGLPVAAIMTVWPMLLGLTTWILHLPFCTALRPVGGLHGSGGGWPALYMVSMGSLGFLREENMVPTFPIPSTVLRVLVSLFCTKLHCPHVESLHGLYQVSVWEKRPSNTNHHHHKIM